MSNMVDRLEKNRKERMNRARKAYLRELSEGGGLRCPDCGEELADPLLPCGFCQAEAEDPELEPAA